MFARQALERLPVVEGLQLALASLERLLYASPSAAAWLATPPAGPTTQEAVADSEVAGVGSVAVQMGGCVIPPPLMVMRDICDQIKAHLTNLAGGLAGKGGDTGGPVWLGTLPLPSLCTFAGPPAGAPPRAPAAGAAGRGGRAAAADAGDCAARGGRGRVAAAVPGGGGGARRGGGGEGPVGRGGLAPA